MDNREDYKEKERELTINRVFNPKTIKKGVIYFIIITLVSLTAIFVYTHTGKTLEVWSQINPSYLLLALVFVFVDLLLGGWRNHIFAREFVPGISQWVCFRANLANMFMGAVTPSQTGGGPAQWYVLYRNGLTIPELISISVINFISTIVFFPLSGFLAYLVLKDNIDQEIVIHIVKVCCYVFGIIALIFFVSIFFPKAMGRMLQKLAKALGRVKQKWGEKFMQLAHKIEKSLTDYRDKSVEILKAKPHLLLYSFVLTIVLYLNKYTLAFLMVLALGINADYLVIVSIAAIVQFLSFIAPSPGASGIAEISIASLMAAILATEYVGSFTLLYRSILVFLPALIGAYVVIKQLSKETQANNTPS